MTNETDDKAVYVVLISPEAYPEMWGIYSTAEKAQAVIRQMEPMEDSPWIEAWNIDANEEERRKMSEPKTQFVFAVMKEGMDKSEECPEIHSVYSTIEKAERAMHKIRSPSVFAWIQPCILDLVD